MNELETQDCVQYDKHFQEVIVRSRGKKIVGPFSAIGKLSSVGFEDEPDLFDLLGQVSKGAYALFNKLKRRRDENNNLAVYNTSELSKTHRETFSRNLKELRDKDIVRVAQRTMHTTNPKRPYITEKQTYMINPALLKCWDFEDANLLWEQCKI